MSASATNARSTAMAPPANALKRKTLAERAGETARQGPAPPSSKPANTFVRATSIAGASRETSFSSSITSSRPSSSASIRHMSNGSHSSYGSSVGPGSRPPSTQSYRPQSAMSYPRTQKPASISGRPATSLEVHEEETGTERIPSKRKGRTPSSSTQSIHAPKVRRCYDVQMGYTSNWESRPFNAVTPREVSISTRLNALHLNGESSHPAPIAEVHERSVSPMAWPAPKAETGVPKTPSHIPKFAPRVVLPGEIPSPTKSSKKTPKTLPKYLTRDSNTLTAFDTDSRLDEVENMYSQLKEKVDSATTESRSLKESMSLYKIRSM